MEKYELKDVLRKNAEGLGNCIKYIKENHDPNFFYESIVGQYELLKSNISSEKHFEEVGGNLLLEKYEAAIAKYKEYSQIEISDEDLVSKIEAIEI